MFSLKEDHDDDRDSSQPFNHRRCEVCARPILQHFDLCPACRAAPENADYVSGRRFYSDTSTDDDGDEVEAVPSYEWASRASSIRTTRDDVLAIAAAYPSWDAHRIALAVGISVRTVREYLDVRSDLPPVERVVLSAFDRDRKLLSAWREHLSTLSGDELIDAVELGAAADLPDGLAEYRDGVNIGGTWVPRWFADEFGHDEPEPVALAQRNATARTLVPANESKADARREKRTQQARARRAAKKGTSP